ncbi:MAG: type II toxin-antitoxin system HicB family antitoxin [Candidatus Sabulitectum sp.]|nr:type II toxin-antitoxin system HicB family antitoxin [Candidatus Sabulitectum sp.]
MIRTFNVIVEKDSDGFYVSTVPALHGCHSQAKSLDELLIRTKEVIELCLEVENSTQESNEFIGVQRLAVSV